MSQVETLNLSIGDQVKDRRLAAKSHAGVIELSGKQVFIDMTADAVEACSASSVPIACELELYFSCLVRKQLRFTEGTGLTPGDDSHAAVIPGFSVSFRAVTTQTCSIDSAGDKPPVETMPIHKPERFVPDWIRIDYRAGQWLGEYGFKRTL